MTLKYILWCVLFYTSIDQIIFFPVLLSFIIAFFPVYPAETVIYRIFYYINRSGTGCITLRELKRGNLIAAMQQVDEEDDINKVIR